MSRSQNLNELRAIIKDLRPIMVEAVKAGQKVLVAGMQRRCPVGKGPLRKSIHATRVGVGRTSAGGSVVVGTKHAIPVEFGTIHRAETPFVRPTAEADGPKAEAEMIRVIKRGTGQ